ncbi:MAG: hypothetical protein ABI602_04790 [Candidatus Saccharibacteria bacterium]
MLKSFHRNGRGDTIVEVMIALSILSFALTTSYSTVNRSMQSARNSQEHSEALQYLNSQVELARADAADSGLYSTASSFCMDATAQPVTLVNPACTAGVEGFYKLSITYATAPSNGINQDIFTFTVTWPGTGQLGQQQEQLNYKIHKT